MITVALTDDQAIVLNGLQKILSTSDEILVTESYSNGEELLNGLKRQQPDVLLLDVQMPGKNGIELAGIVKKKYPRIHIIAVTNIDITVQVKKMLQQGCSGYLLKDSSPATIVAAIKAVHAGEQYLSESVSRQLLSSMFSDNVQNPLTKREKEILRLISEEFTNQEIADKLFLSIRTVENHRTNLLQKLGAKNAAGLIKTALLDGLI
jgi:DNA-binding NarL/FixJ family response regulator